MNLDAIHESFALKPEGEDRYTAPNATLGQVIFGGQLLGQSMIAAKVGHDDKEVKTVHTVFARGGKYDAPVEITVDRMHEGRAFASSSVTISQGDRLVTRSIVLLSADEDDVIRHADPAPDVAGPDDCPVGHFEIEGWDTRIVGGVDLLDPDAPVGPPDTQVWSRWALESGPRDVITNQAFMAFASDPYLIATAMRPHRGVGQAQAHKTLSTGVIGHTLTFHEPFDASEWLLMANHSPYAGRGRSYGRADVFTTDGRLVASFVQDNMIRSMGDRTW
jgi:acyl-CoA thioesterase